MTGPPAAACPGGAGVIEAVRDVDAVAAEHRDAYQRFTARFCPLDDGKAGARVCDRVFAP